MSVGGRVGTLKGIEGMNEYMSGGEMGLWENIEYV
jgi:hypothetical protein